MIPVMSEEVYKLFPLRRVRPTWNFLFDRMHSAEDIDELKKAKWIEAFEFLKGEMGTGFFDTCGIDHPVSNKLDNAPGLLDNLLSFVDTLQRLKERDSNYEFLMTKIRSRDLCKKEGIFFTEVVDQFLSNGFNVFFPKELETQKNPDIQITDPHTNEKFFIEVSGVNESEKRKKSQNEHHIISNTFINYGYDLLNSSKQLKHIEESEMAQIVNAIKRTKDKAFNDKSLELYNDDWIDIAVAHPSQSAAFSLWCKENKRENGISGLSLELNDVQRILKNNKIEKEVKQLPENFSGLLYFPVDFLSFFSMDKADVFVQILSQICKHKHLLGLLLYSDIGQTLPEQSANFEGHCFSTKKINGVSRQTMFVSNPEYKGCLSSPTIQRIKQSIC